MRRPHRSAWGLAALVLLLAAPATRAAAQEFQVFTIRCSMSGSGYYRAVAGGEVRLFLAESDRPDAKRLREVKAKALPKGLFEFEVTAPAPEGSFWVFEARAPGYEHTVVRVPGHYTAFHDPVRIAVNGAGTVRGLSLIHI